MGKSLRRIRLAKMAILYLGGSRKLMKAGLAVVWVPMFRDFYLEIESSPAVIGRTMSFGTAMAFVPSQCGCNLRGDDATDTCTVVKPNTTLAADFLSSWPCTRYIRTLAIEVAA
jgi:hypothetical protein